MPWVSNDSGQYFHQSQRVNGRVVSKYYGAGPDAQLLALEIQERQARREERAAARRRILAECREAQQLLASFEKHVQLLIRARLLLAGWHQHHRSEWRKRVS